MTARDAVLKQFVARAFACSVTIGVYLALQSGALGQAPSNASHEMYLELQRRADSFVGQPLSFAGKVIQSVRSGEGYALRINVTPGNYNSWQDTIYVDYSALARTIQNGVAEGNLVSVRGTFAGIRSYLSVLGETIQVPSVVACAIQPGLGNIPACPGETAMAPARSGR
jgi:hypothetical protein